MKIGEITLALALLLPLSPATALSEASGRNSIEVEAGYRHDSFSVSAIKDWSEYYLLAAADLDGKGKLIAEHAYLGRFGDTDTNLRLEYVFPQRNGWLGAFSGQGSGKGAFLPEWGAKGDLGYAYGNGTVSSAGLDHRHYSESSVTMLSFMVKHYWSSFRAHYTLNLSSIEGESGQGINHRAGLDHFYGDRSRIGLMVFSGSEIEKVGQSGLLTSDVAGVLVLGNHWFSPRWAFIYTLGATENQGSHTRVTAHGGFRHLF